MARFHPGLAPNCMVGSDLQTRPGIRNLPRIRRSCLIPRQLPRLSRDNPLGLSDTALLKIAEVNEMSITARKARMIRRGCQRRSQNRDGLGVSELFLAPPNEAAVILSASDIRLKYYLLGFSKLPGQRNGSSN